MEEKVRDEEAWAIIDRAHSRAIREIGGTGWLALGRGGSAWARHVIEVAEDLGLRRLGAGRPIEGPVWRLPTGSASHGGPGARMRHYVGRWQIAPQVPKGRTITEWMRKQREGQ